MVFVLPGQGTERPGMGSALYRSEIVYRDAIDRCAELLRGLLDVDLRIVLGPSGSEEERTPRLLERTEYAQPALFAVEYAVAKLLMSWGVQPNIIVGHSLGEYVGACLADVFSLEEGLELVAWRGQLLQSIVPGAMLAASLPEADARVYAGADLDIAAVNSPTDVVFSGLREAVEEIHGRLRDAGVSCRMLATSLAFHSRLVEPAIPPFEDLLRRVHLSPPQIPFISTVTGSWVTNAEATSHSYWVDHIRQPVQFAHAVGILMGRARSVVIEIGPGNTLTSLMRRSSKAGSGSATFVTTMPDGVDGGSDVTQLTKALANSWSRGGHD